MKPIRLKFAGIQSYRDEQDINFEEAGALGIFGVFGPTGSGKSTILDAVTLALFGKVERAKGGTRGIINQYEDKLSVSFEFELGRDRYLAERLYVRDKNDQDSVKNKNARLVRLNDGETVLADKSTEVDARVTELLGMNFDDFSRAVVLPQGKFDQFLKLTGGERAKMLEHIFLLERYGEALYRKASELEDKLKNEIDTTSRLMEQLGDASEDNIKKTEEEHRRVKEILKEKENALKIMEDRLKNLEFAKNVYNENIALIKELNILESRVSDINLIRQRLEKGVKAEPYRGFISQADELARKIEEEKEKLNLIEKRAESLKPRISTAAQKVNAVKNGEAELNQLRNEELPKAKVALEHEKQAAGILAEINRNKNLFRESQSALSKLSEEGKKKGQLIDNIKKRKEVIESDIKTCLDILSCRHETDLAMAALSELENAISSEVEAGKSLEKKTEAKNALLNEIVKLLSVEVDLPANSSEKMINDLLITAHELVGKAEKDRKDAALELEKSMELNMAGVLAGKLEYGKPCPVCGSIDHPAPVMNSFKENTVENAKKVLAEREKTMERIRRWENDCRSKGIILNSLQEEIDKVIIPVWEEKKELLEKATDNFRNKYAYLKDKAQTISAIAVHFNCNDISVMGENTKSVKKLLEEADKRNGILAEELKSLDSQITKLEAELNELRMQYREQGARNNGLTDSINRLNEQYSELQNKIRSIIGESFAQEYEKNVTEKISAMIAEHEKTMSEWEQLQKEEIEVNQQRSVIWAGMEKIKEHFEKTMQELKQSIIREGFSNIEELRQCLMEASAREELSRKVEDFDKSMETIRQTIQINQDKLREKPYVEGEYETAVKALEAAKEEYQMLVREEGALNNQLAVLKDKNNRWQQLSLNKEELAKRKESAERLVTLLKGRKFVQFLAEEHLADMTTEASMRLGLLTGQRYALELDEGCNFVMRDEYSGGMRRPVNTLSGGETFLTSLAMALALSSKIQLKGKYPLGFFFLDEGFGTLDPEKLEIVMNTLEKLHDGHRMVGVITHVQELKNRMPRYLEVIPASMDGTGSKVILKKN